MVQVIAATFENGVFKPDEQPQIAENARVRLLVESLEEDEEQVRRQQAWESLADLWQHSKFDSQGDRLSRDALHERR